MMERRKNLNDKFGFVDSMKIKDFIDYEQPNEYVVESDRYSSKYSTPVLTAGQSFILGYTNESKGIYKKGPCIIFDDFTTSVHYVDFPFKVKSSAMKILTTKSNTDLKYCYYLLLSLSKMPPNHKRQWISTTSEKTHELPSMDKQIAIVKQLDLISDTIAIYTKQIENFDNLVKARFIEMFGDPIVNDKGWQTKPLLDMGQCKNGMNFHYDDKGIDINCLGVCDFKNFSVIDNTKGLPTVSLNEMPSEEYLLKDDDIVFVRSNGNKALVGRSLVVYPGNVPTTFSGFCIRYRKYDNEIIVPYLLRVLKTDSVRMKMAGRGANIQNLNQQILGTLVIPVPPIELQQQFADFVRQVDKSREAVKKSLEKTQQLYDSLMQEYFG